MCLNKEYNHQTKIFLPKLIKQRISLTGISLIIGIYLCLSFNWPIEKGIKQSTSLLIPDIYNSAMCSPLKSVRLQINMEDIYNSSIPLAPLLKIKWQSKLEISSSSDIAKEFFNQGLLNIYAFNHAEADRSFKEAIRQDSSCAMCHWGVALGLGPNINLPMQQEDNIEAVKYSKKALRLSHNTLPHEKALIEALATRYSNDTLVARSTLDSIYASEMRLVFAAI